MDPCDKHRDDGMGRGGSSGVIPVLSRDLYSLLCPDTGPGSALPSGMTSRVMTASLPIPARQRYEPAASPIALVKASTEASTLAFLSSGQGMDFRVSRFSITLVMSAMAINWSVISFMM